MQYSLSKFCMAVTIAYTVKSLDTRCHCALGPGPSQGEKQEACWSDYTAESKESKQLTLDAVKY